MKNFHYAGGLLLLLFALLFGQKGWNHVAGVVGAWRGGGPEAKTVQNQFMQELKQWRRVPLADKRPPGPPEPLPTRNPVRLSSRSPMTGEDFRLALNSGLPVFQARHGQQFVHTTSPLRQPDLRLTSSLRLDGKTVYTYRQL